MAIRSLLVFLIIISSSIILLPVTLAAAQVSSKNDANTVANTSNQAMEQALLDPILAPIALYPDSLLSHVLLASTYPLQVVQAARWRSQNQDLTAEQAREAIADKDWDPSVKALIPFTALLQKMSDDLDWLQALGAAFINHEQQVLASIQSLRHKAYSNGNLEDNQYLDIEQDQEQIVIESRQKDVIYVPYYDTRVIFGPWWHHRSKPVYWHHPRHFSNKGGFYWSPSVYISPTFYFSGFHWHTGHLVTHSNYHHQSSQPSYPRGYYYKRVYSKEYQRWSQQKVLRKSIHYHSHAKPHPKAKVKTVTTVTLGNNLRRATSKAPTQAYASYKKLPAGYHHNQKRHISSSRFAQDSQAVRNHSGIKRNND